LGAFDRNSRTNPGFDPTHVLAGQLRLSAIAYPTPAERWEFVKSLTERLRATPGVVEARTTHNLFLPGFSFVTLTSIEGRPSPDGKPYTVQFRRVSPGYFRAMRIPELRGRTFTDRDSDAALQVAVVSRLFADRYWPGEEAHGRRVVRANDPKTWPTVVG